MENQINSTNWSYCRYEGNNRIALITIGASPEMVSTEDFLYFVTVLNKDEELIYQEEFLELEKACQSINDKYEGLWQLTDQLEKNKNSSGCGSCVAH